MRNEFRRKLKLSDLETLMAVVESGGISKAAERLNYSQSAVSKAIASLEHTVGQRLLERNRNGIVTTTYGEALLRCGIAVKDDVGRCLAEFDYISDPTCGEVRIGCTPPVSIGFLPIVIDRITQRYPKIIIHVVPGESAELSRRLASREIDVAIRRLIDSDPEPHQKLDFLMQEKILIIAGSKHRCARMRRVRLADLVHESWVLQPPWSFIRKAVTEAFRTQGLGRPRLSVEVVDPHLALLLASRGHLLAALPEGMVKIPGKNLPVKVLPLELPGGRRPVGIVTLQDRPLSPAVKLFIEHAHAAANGMGSSHRM